MPSKRIFLWLVPLLIVVLITSATFLYPFLRARYLLSQLEELQINHSTFEDAQKLAKKIGAQEGSFTKCTRAECEWYKITDNALVPQWYRGKGVSFAVVITAKDSLVTSKGVEYSVGVGTPTVGEAFIGRPRVYVSQTENCFKWDEEKQRKLQEKFREKFPDIVETPVRKGWQKIWCKDEKIASDAFAVCISTRYKSTPEDWKKYTAFNYSCFWKYKGCSYGKDLLTIADPYPPRPC